MENHGFMEIIHLYDTIHFKTGFKRSDSGLIFDRTCQHILIPRWVRSIANVRALWNAFFSKYHFSSEFCFFLTYSKFISRRCLIGYSQGDVRLDTNSHKVLNKSSFGVYWWACSSTGCFTLLFTWALHWSLHVFLQVQSTASWPKCVYCLTQKSHLLFSALNSVMDLEFRSLLEDLSQTVTSSMPVPCARGPPEHCPPTKHSVFSLKQECKSNYGIFCSFNILKLIPLPLPNSTIMSVFSTWPWPTLTTKTTYVYHHSQNYIVAAQQWPWYHHSLVRSRHLNNLLKFRYSGTFWLGLEKLFGLGLNRYIFYVTSLTYIHN